ncbi:scarecrow-like protein 21 [Argentina anserina]|uniref:scarecrow-like protein 21 n=1 Tax=Argentina anserina TaxID=57926 RepID=UPI0021766962|nr:scarecrow-like protein 21 [Potentilla anserina]
MRATERHGSVSHRFGEQPVEEPESCGFPPIHDVVIHGSHLSAHNFEQYESSSATSNYRVPSSPSSLSFSANGSPTSQPDFQSYQSSGSPVNQSCYTNDVGGLSHKIKEFESLLLGSESDALDIFGIRSQVRHNQVWAEEQNRKQMMMEMISRGDLKEVLYACAKALAENDMSTTEWLMSNLRQMVSVSGEPIQRLGAYMLEGLVARLASTGGCIYASLRCKEPASNELLSYMHILYEVCPYFKFGYVSANGAIAEAMKDESRVHIIDFQIAQGSQWITLIQALASRPGGPPHIRLTGIDDSTSAYARGGGLDLVGKRLSRLAESYRVPFEFHAAGICASEVQIKDLGVQVGEALAVNFAFILHHMPDESVSIQNHRDRLLRVVKSLSPKVVTLVEQESNTNTAPFCPRFAEAFSYYRAVFDSIDAALPREDKERINVEQHCLAREIVNIIACEGVERVERTELLSKWRSRFIMAGFSPYPLSTIINATIKTLLQSYSEKYTLEERDGALYLGWNSQALVASCAWR